MDWLCQLQNAFSVHVQRYVLSSCRVAAFIEVAVPWWPREQTVCHSNGARLSTSVQRKLMATAVAMYSRRSFSKRWHVDDVKNITIDDQATLMVDRNSAKYRAYLPIIRLRNHDLCSADGGGFRRSLKRHTVDVKKIVWRWPNNPKDRSKFRNDQNLCLRDKARPLEKYLFAARTSPLMMPLRTVFFLLSLATAFVLAYEK